MRPFPCFPHSALEVTAAPLPTLRGPCGWHGGRHAAGSWSGPLAKRTEGPGWEEPREDPGVCSHPAPEGLPCGRGLARGGAHQLLPLHSCVAGPPAVDGLGFSAETFRYCRSRAAPNSLKIGRCDTGSYFRNHFHPSRSN